MIQGDTSGAVSHSLPPPWTLLLADARGNKTGSREGVGQGWGPGAAFEAAPCLSPHPGPQRPMQPLPGSQSSAAGPPEPTVAEIKAVVVGDGGCGKTSLLMVFARGDFPKVRGLSPPPAAPGWGLQLPMPPPVPTRSTSPQCLRSTRPPSGSGASPPRSTSGTRQVGREGQPRAQGSPTWHLPGWGDRWGSSAWNPGVTVWRPLGHRRAGGLRQAAPAVLLRHQRCPHMLRCHQPQQL